MAEPKHRRHEWSAVRELRVPKRAPRHAEPGTRLGADDPGVRALFEAFVVPREIREMGRRSS